VPAGRPCRIWGPVLVCDIGPQMPAFGEGRLPAGRASSEPLGSGAGVGAVDAESTPRPLEIRLLGLFEIRLRGRPVGLTGDKRRGLLTVLALVQGRVVDVEELIEALWGDDLPAAPRNAVQHHVARLRAALGAEWIVASPHGYALQDAWVDALWFEELLGNARVALREADARGGSESVSLALGLWRGPALQGLTDTLWLRTEAQRLEALRVDALEDQFEAALALGEHRENVSSLRTALEESPFRERLWGQLMLALYRSGRQADALEAFQEARRVLGAELGLEPGPELRGLQEAILAHDPAIAPVRVAPHRRGNLPAPSTSFIDRETEMAQVVELMVEHRLVTLAGPPGVGKTRLALEAARSLETDIRDGAWLVELARAGGAADVPRLLAQALDARGADPLAQVIARLRDAEAIVVVDACEHALASVGRIVSAVLGDCPQVRVLVTSREVLHLAGEARVTVGPLPLTDAESTDGAGSPAMQLFIARARAARPGFELSREAAPLAAEIARRTDGLPLAIELAAARLGVLGLAELLSLVEQRVTALRNRPASDPSRTALQELVDWSYELLHVDEKTLLHQIAVHRGGASLPSLLAVSADHGLDETTVTYLLGALVDKSIVSVSFPREEARYDLLDTVRDYTLERLAESEDLAPVRKAHADYFVTLAEAARTGLRGSEWLTWTNQLELENDNLWAALAYARDAPDPEVAVRLAGSLGWYFSFSERVSEGRRFLELARAIAPVDAPAGLRPELLASICFLATEELDLDAAIEAGETALSLVGTAPASSEVRSLLALALVPSGQRERAATLAGEARAAAEAAGDHWGAAVASIVGAQVALVAGDIPSMELFSINAARHSEAIEYLPGLLPATMLQASAAEQRGDSEGATALYRRVFELSNQTRFADHAAFALAKLGCGALAKGDPRQAEELFRRALAAADAARAPWVTAYARVQLGRVFAASGDSDTAERLYRQALDWSERPRPHRARESLQLVIAGSPGSAALLGLAELAEARGDAAAAGELRSRAALALA
jgi:predicted ATPase/DNA-binding SARP family transcriptional activator